MQGDYSISIVNILNVKNKSIILIYWVPCGPHQWRWLKPRGALTSPRLFTLSYFFLTYPAGNSVQGGTDISRAKLITQNALRFIGQS